MASGGPAVSPERPSPERPSPERLFSERLTVPWWAWLGALAVAAFAALELGIGALWLRHPLTYVVLGLLAVLGVAPLGRVRTTVGDGELRVDDAHLPVRHVAAVSVVDTAGRLQLLGVDADPLAFVIQRPWIGGGVRVDLDDPADPTPYWFISSRRPEELAAALTAAKSRAVTSAG